MKTIQQTDNCENYINLKHWFIHKLALIFEMNENNIRTDVPVIDYGLDSMNSLAIAGELEEMLEIEIPNTLLWDYPTIDKVTNYLLKQIT